MSMATARDMAMSQPYEPLTQENGLPGLQSQYPTGPDMSTFGGGMGTGAYVPPPSHGEAGLSKAHGESHDEHGGGGHGEHGGHEQIDKDSGMAPRRCTDVQTCFCFLVYLILAMTLLAVANQHGNTARLTRGTDYYGRICGADPGVENLPFLFWCRADPGSAGIPTDLDLDHPSCVPYCPSSDNPAVKISCLQQSQETVQTIEGGQFGNSQTMVVEMQESIVHTAPYATRPRGGRYCIPLDATLENKVLSDNKALGPWSQNRLLTVVGTLGHLYWLLLAATVLTLLLGSAYIYAVRHCPYTIAKVFLMPLLLMMILFTVWYLGAIGPIIDKTSGFSEWYVPRQNVYKHWDFDKASWLCILLGFFCLSFSLVIAGTIYNFQQIGITDLMNSAFETFKSVPSLPYVPVVEGIAKFLIFWMGLSGFSVIMAEGWIEKNRIHVNGAKFAGLSRDFVPSVEDVRFWLMAVVWIFLFYWAMEACTAIGQFVTSYATFKYFATKKVNGKKPPLPSGVVSTGLKFALIYHPGSILRGALWTPLWRPVRILNWMTAEFDGRESDSWLMSMVKCLPCGWCFSSIQSWSKDCLKEGELHHGDIQDVPCKDGFDDVVVRANDFDKGCEKAHELLEHSHRITQYLYRDHSQTTINLIGVGGIATSVSIAVYLLVVNLDIYKESTSPLFVADPILLTVLTWILSAYIAFGFMTLWDHTADSLLYCYAWARRWNRKTVNNFIPESLRYIVGQDDMESDRYPYYGKAKNNMYLRYWLPMVGMEDPKKQKSSKDKDASTAKTKMPSSPTAQTPLQMIPESP